MSKNSVFKTFGLVLLVGFIAALPSFFTGIEIEPDGLTIATGIEIEPDGLTIATGIEIEPDGWSSSPQLSAAHSPHAAARARYSAAFSGRFQAA